MRRAVAYGLGALVTVIAASVTAARAVEPPQTVSLVRLIADPESLDGKRVRVTGFCSLEFEGTSVYLHEEDYRRTLLPNAVGLDVEHAWRGNPNPIHEKYCIVEATFSAKRGSNGRAGRLLNVTRLERLPSHQELSPDGR